MRLCFVGNDGIPDIIITPLINTGRIDEGEGWQFS